MKGVYVGRVLVAQSKMSGIVIVDSNVHVSYSHKSHEIKLTSRLLWLGGGELDKL